MVEHIISVGGAQLVDCKDDQGRKPEDMAHHEFVRTFLCQVGFSSIIAEHAIVCL
jgi:hypothetical protein